MTLCRHAAMNLIAIALLSISSHGDLESDLSKVILPPGFTISVYAEGLTNPRQMALGDKGTLFVGSRTTGNVYAVVDSDGDFKGDKTYTVVVRTDGVKSCTCSGFIYRRHCRHVDEYKKELGIK